MPVALVPLLRIEEAVAELRRASDLGAKGLYAFSIPPNGISYGDPYYDPLWAECQDRQIPIGIHVSNTPLHSGREYYEGGFGANSWFFTLMYNPDCQIAFTSFFQGGALERFPHLSVGVVETGCGWIAHWVELMDAKYKMNGHDQMQRPPSEYFERQCWISGEPHERSFAHMAQLMGSHKLMWGSDYPHEEGHDNPVVELQETLSKLSSADVTKILGANALQTYAIG